MHLWDFSNIQSLEKGTFSLLQSWQFWDLQHKIFDIWSAVWTVMIDQWTRPPTRTEKKKASLNCLLDFFAFVYIILILSFEFSFAPEPCWRSKLQTLYMLCMYVVGKEWKIFDHNVYGNKNLFCIIVLYQTFFPLKIPPKTLTILKHAHSQPMYNTCSDPIISCFSGFGGENHKSVTQCTFSGR